MFNQALDRYRRFLNDRSQAVLLPQVEAGATEAAAVFQALRPEAPASAPLQAYWTRCRKLVAEVEALRIPARAPPQGTVQPAATQSFEDMRKRPAFQEGARLFNQAVAQFKLYQTDTSRKDLLKPTEELARQAAERFESLKPQAPASFHKEIDRYIHQSYGMVSACRGEQLKDGDPSPANRDPANMRRRPALPAYQNPP